MFFKKDDPKLIKNRKVSSHYEEGAFVSKVQEYYRHFFYQAIDMVVNCIRNRFQQKEYIEALQTMEILLLTSANAFVYYQTQLKTLIYIVNEKQAGKKDAIKIISSLNASQKLLGSEVLKLVKLINSTRHECCQ